MVVTIALPPLDSWRSSCSRCMAVVLSRPCIILLSASACSNDTVTAAFTSWTFEGQAGLSLSPAARAAQLLRMI